MRALGSQAAGKMERTRSRYKKPRGCRAMVKKRNALSSVRTAVKLSRIDRIRNTSDWPRYRYYDLTELPAACHRVFGFMRTKDIRSRQALYERHKLLKLPAHG